MAAVEVAAGWQTDGGIKIQHARDEGEELSEVFVGHSPSVLAGAGGSVLSRPQLSQLAWTF